MKLVIWAQEVCKSTAALYRALDPMALAVFDEDPAMRELRTQQGQCADELPGAVHLGLDRHKAMAFLSKQPADAIHLFSGYQKYPLCREMIHSACRAGARVWVYDEAPCEMCTGVKAWLKRMYYRFVLPRRMKPVVEECQGIISASGRMGEDRLRRLGWQRIVPFGYAPAVEGASGRSEGRTGPLRVLHLGNEAAYRGVSTAIAACREANVELIRTQGAADWTDVSRRLAECDVVVACGLCEPWGIRVNDAIGAGKPVIVSDGMGAAMMVEAFGAGCVVPKGDSAALARVLKRCAADAGFLARLKSGARAAAEAWTPQARAKELLGVMDGPVRQTSGFEVNGMQVVDGLLRRHGQIAENEVWVHGMWTPDKWWKCLKAKLTGKKLVRMTHGSLSPIYLERQGKWKKRLVKPIEKICFALADRLVGTGTWEIEWARQWGLKKTMEVIDLKQFFKFDLETVATRREALRCRAKDVPLKVLYLGREHPLKGTDGLRKAVEGLCVELREVNDHSGEALERDWDWADVLVLPTLSENFGLVVAEALEHGKPVITTDGAPAWRIYFEQHPDAGIYLKGYRDGSEEKRIKLLADALKTFVE